MLGPFRRTKTSYSYISNKVEKIYSKWAEFLLHLSSSWACSKLQLLAICCLQFTWMFVYFQPNSWGQKVFLRNKLPNRAVAQSKNTVCLQVQTFRQMVLGFRTRSMAISISLLTFIVNCRLLMICSLLSSRCRRFTDSLSSEMISCSVFTSTRDGPTKLTRDVPMNLGKSKSKSVSLQSASPKSSKYIN